MDWNCAVTEERLSDVLDGALSVDDLAAYSAHAAGCSRCAQIVAQVSGVVQQVQRLPLVEEPPFLAAKIITATRGAPAQEWSAKGWFAWLPAIWPARLAMGALTVAASFLIVFHAFGALPHKMALNPANLYHSANRHAHLTYARGVRFFNTMRVVYVIESRVFSEPHLAPQPTLTPGTRPTVTPQQQPPDSDARPNRQAAPPPGHRRTPRTTELAVLMVTRRLSNARDVTSRSFL